MLKQSSLIMAGKSAATIKTVKPHGDLVTLQQQFDDQQFANEYQLVNGVAMHAENPDNFQIPPQVSGNAYEWEETENDLVNNRT